jgi:hypothetical protein
MPTARFGMATDAFSTRSLKQWESRPQKRFDEQVVEKRVNKRDIIKAR